MRLAVGICCAIAGRGHKQHTGISRPGNGIIQRLTITTTTPAVTQHAGTLGHGEIDATDRATHVSPAIGTQEFAGHELHFPSNSHVDKAVIGSGANRTSAVCPVAIVIHRIAVAVHCIDAVDIIHIPIAIIVHTITGNFARVHPHLPGQVLMCITNTRIDHGHNHLGRSSGRIPCSRCPQIHSRHTAILASITQPP